MAVLNLLNGENDMRVDNNFWIIEITTKGTFFQIN